MEDIPVVTWRLSRIEEELQNLNFTSSPEEDVGSAMEDNLPPPPPEFITEINKLTELDKERQHAVGIYSEAVVMDNTLKRQQSNQKQGIKRITDKYDKPRLVEGPHVVTGVDTSFPTAVSSVSIDPPAPPLCVSDGKPVVNFAPCDPRPATKPTTSNGILSEQEVLQVEMFFRSHKTTVCVCQCNVKLFFGYVNERPEHWPFVKQGALVLVLNSGESRRQRRLCIVLAEKGTGFIIWKDVINHLSAYNDIHPNFHVMHLSSDHTKMAGFMYDDAVSAIGFLQKYQTITAAHDSILSLSGKSKKKEKQKNKKYKAPNKADISQPCQFTHVTKLECPEAVIAHHPPNVTSGPSAGTPQAGSS